MQRLTCPARLVHPPNLKYLLAQAFRVAEDVEPKHARLIAKNLGGDLDLILESGYRVASGGFLATIRRQNFEIPKFVGTLRPFTNSPEDQKQEAWECAADWLAHINPVPRRPLRPIRRIHFPINRQRRKHHSFGRRAAA